MKAKELLWFVTGERPSVGTYYLRDNPTVSVEITAEDRKGGYVRIRYKHLSPEYLSNRTFHFVYTKYRSVTPW